MISELPLGWKTRMQRFMTATFVRLLILGALAGLTLSCVEVEREPPALVVYVAVDQLRGDLLERYDSLFTGGIRRLMDQGFRFTGTTHDHAHTATAVGHSTLSTGVFPSRNGIVGNSWMEETAEGWRSVYSFGDTLAHILGLPALEGRSSRNLLRSGLADWILEADSGAHVVSVSKKDRAAIAMGGKARGHVYWIAEAQGRFVTSSHYAGQYPEWVERFNREAMPEILGDSVWEQGVPERARSLSRRDTAAYEGDGTHTYFPHRLQDEAEGEDTADRNRWAIRTPWPDRAVGAFAREAVQALGMGQDPVTDYLGLSFSQVDYVGHDYGPLSREQLDNLLHLDEVMGELMGFLDETVGPDRWVLAFTADHGVLTIPEYLVEQGQEASRARAEDFRTLRSTFEEYRSAEGDPLSISEELAGALEELPFIADALTIPELTTGPPADSFVVLMRNSFHPERWNYGAGSEGSGVVFRFPELFYPSTSERGTGHGSPYYYDRWVPLVFYGAGVEPGVSDAPSRTVDIAPTLAWLAGIPTPPDLDGTPLLEERNP